MAETRSPLRAIRAVQHFAAEHPGVALLCVLAISAAFHLALLMRTPAPFVDEGWYASRAWGLLHTGYSFGSVDLGVLENYPGYEYYFPYLASVIHAPFLAMAGPTLLAVRLASLTFGILLLVAIYSIARSLYGRGVGLLSVLVISAIHSFLLAAHLGRHDVVVAAMGFGAIALFYLANKERFGWLTLLAGLLAALSVDVHPNGLLYVIVLGLLCLIEQGRRFYRSGRLWALIAGSAIGLAFYVTIHILPVPGPKAYFEMNKIIIAGSRSPPALSLDLAGWVRSIWETLGLMTGMLGAPVALLTAGGLALMLTRRGDSDRKALITLGILFFAASGLLQAKAPHYAILVTPFCAILVSVLLVWAMQVRWKERAAALALRSVLAALLITSLVQEVNSARQDPIPDYDTALQHIRTFVPPDAVIIGPQTYWFARPESRYLSWDQIYYYRRHSPGASIEEAMSALQPDVFITDGWVEIFLTDDAALLSQPDGTYLSLSEMRAYLDRNATLLDKLETATFGTIRIYRIKRGL